MTYDSRERMNAEQKEATPSYRQISYDPYTQIESYHGEVTDAVNQAYETAGGAGLGPAHTPDLDEFNRREDLAKYEMSAEVASPPLQRPISRDVNDRDVNDREERPGEQATGSGFGLTGLSLSVLSLFILPYLTAPVGIILGYMAYRRDARTLGLWAMILGAISIVGAMVVYPYLVAK